MNARGTSAVPGALPQGQNSPQTPPLQVALPFAGTGHTVHDGPHAVGLSGTHWPVQ